jgi:prepilin-type N-terminal cleavage/methylation domain-containing protein
MKKGFTLIEMLIVVVVLAIMISMIPFRMQSLQAHTKFSLSMNDWEDYWQKTVIRMRQSNQFKEAIITLHTTGANVLYS